MRIGSLFSGIGGLELGLEWSGLGETVWQVEQNKFCLAVLTKHWPNAERFDDVCKVGKSNLAPVDLICGGFPCQDVSSAGARRGLAGERSGLWREFARVVAELSPEWVVIENVASGATLWFDAIVRDLDELDYGVLPIPLSAFDVGAPHRRARVFVVANSNGDRQHVCSEHAQVAGAQAPLVHTESERRNPRSISESEACGRRRSGPSDGSWWATEPELARMAYGVPDRVERNHALGNSAVPQCAEVVGWVIRELIEQAAKECAA
jgi:DNA (cytosine-5)-methyltransferase 1